MPTLRNKWNCYKLIRLQMYSTRCFVYIYRNSPSLTSFPLLLVKALCKLSQLILTPGTNVCMVWFGLEQWEESGMNLDFEGKQCLEIKARFFCLQTQPFVNVLLHLWMSAASSVSLESTPSFSMILYTLKTTVFWLHNAAIHGKIFFAIIREKGVSILQGSEHILWDVLPYSVHGQKHKPPWS